MPYKGDSETGLRQGWGTYEYDCAKYEGNWEHGQRHGIGTIQLPGAMYKGTFFRGEIQGNGIMQWDNGKLYVGQFNQGQPEGKGLLISSVGNFYRGSFVNGHENGIGTLESGHEPSCKRLSCIEFDKIDPHEVPVYEEIEKFIVPCACQYVSIYQGEFAQGQPHGPGKRTKCWNNTVECGNFLRGVLHDDQGEIHYGEMAIYRGAIEYGRRSGTGSLEPKQSDNHTTEIVSYRGKWHDDQPAFSSNVMSVEIGPCCPNHLLPTICSNEHENTDHASEKKQAKTKKGANSNASVVPTFSTVISYNRSDVLKAIKAEDSPSTLPIAKSSPRKTPRSARDKAPKDEKPAQDTLHSTTPSDFCSEKQRAISALQTLNTINWSQIDHSSLPQKHLYFSETDSQDSIIALTPGDFLPEIVVRTLHQSDKLDKQADENSLNFKQSLKHDAELLAKDTIQFETQAKGAKANKKNAADIEAQKLLEFTNHFERLLGFSTDYQHFLAKGLDRGYSLSTQESGRQVIARLRAVEFVNRSGTDTTNTNTEGGQDPATQEQTTTDLTPDLAGTTLDTRLMDIQVYAAKTSPKSLLEQHSSKQVYRTNSLSKVNDTQDNATEQNDLQEKEFAEQNHRQSEQLQTLRTGPKPGSLKEIAVKKSHDEQKPEESSKERLASTQKKLMEEVATIVGRYWDVNPHEESQISNTDVEEEHAQEASQFKISKVASLVPTANGMTVLPEGCIRIPSQTPPGKYQMEIVDISRYLLFGRRLPLVTIPITIIASQ